MSIGSSVKKHAQRKESFLALTAQFGSWLLLFCLLSTILAGIASANPGGGDDDKGKKKNSLTLVKVYDLCFGAVVTSSVSGTVKISPDGTMTSQGGVYPIHVAGFAPSAALFKLTIHNASDGDDDEHECDESEHDDNRTDDDRTTFGRDGVTVGVTLPSSITLKSPGGAKMTADQFTLKRTNGNINVGATLHVNANQSNAVYTGTFLITTVLE